MAFIRRLLCFLAYSVWFGGFTFYISVVVPIGTDVLGSAKAQGFVTQQVTHHLNWITLLVVVLVGWEVLTGCSGIRKRKTLGVVLLAAILALTLTLIYLHTVLDGYLDFEQRTVRQKSSFYQWHRAYLWTSTLQWFLGIVLGGTLLLNWSRPISDFAEENEE